MPIDAVPLDVDALPGIVCGPIVRRLTRTRVSIWLATVAPDAITLTVREVGGADTTTVTTTPARIGSQLWMTVLTADAPAGQFAAGHTYEYELTAPWEATRGGIPWADLALPGHSRPTFLAPPDAVGDLRLMHTSCRKPHGNGRDALALAMDELGRRFGTAPPPQPHLLVLSGDQIYADEVGHAVISRIVRIAADLIGIDETDVFGEPPIIAGRGPATRAFGFTGSTANHLWTFGEFVALYLLMWSPTLWPAVLPPHPIASSLPPFDVDPSVSESEWNNELANVELFVAVVADVRRVLANVATLMIFDDHEVTDDWNIDHDWAAKIYGAEKGRRVVTNALLAYLVCQHWGNRPDRFTAVQTAERRVLDEMEAAGASGLSHADAVPLLLGVPIAPPAAPTLAQPQALRDLTAPGTVRYDVTLDDADGWPVRIVLLDERTAREYPSDQGLGARISLAGLAAQLPPPATAAPLTIVVAASPILGTYVYEDVIQPLLRLLGGQEGVRRADNEPWSTVPANFQDLLARLATHHPVLVLSGDVHYGYTSAASRTDGTGTTRIAQFTSSGAKNFTFKHSALGQYGELGLKLGLERTRAFAGYTALSAADRQRLVGAPPAGTALAWDDLGEVLDGRTARDGASTPTALPAPVATAYGLPPPEWSYEIGPVDDPMADFTGPPVDVPWSGWQPDRSLATTEALQHADLARLSKMFVGLPNLGIVWVEVAGSTLSVHQELRCPVGTVEPGPPGSRHSVNTTVALT